MSNLTWKKYHPLSDKNAFICLVDSMGDDSSIVQAARVSYGKDTRNKGQNHPLIKAIKRFFPDTKEIDYVSEDFEEKHIKFGWGSSFRIVKGDDLQYRLIYEEAIRLEVEQKTKDRQLIRYLMNHQHSTPFEMVEIKFMVQVPMDCWRQWVRHRTASVNEYSTRYTEALDFFQVTAPNEWRLQAADNKQGSSGFLEEWPEGEEFEYLPSHRGTNVVWRKDNKVVSWDVPFDWWSDIGYAENPNEYDEITPGQFLTWLELEEGKDNEERYRLRLALGIAKEQARKDLPLSTYTRAYWKCDLHNIFNFLRLRMDSHAQLEIRQFANCMFEIVKQICPVACGAFEDYVLHAKKFSRMEMEMLRANFDLDDVDWNKPDNMTDREWKEFMEKLK